jgi:hypothetical protein
MISLACRVALLTLLLAAESRAGSVAVESLSFGRAVTRSARVVQGRVAGRTELKLDGGVLQGVEIAVDRALKGAPARPAERIRVFEPGDWFRHTHAAAMRGGVVSYADPRYATPVPDGELVPGAVVIAFLSADPPPSGFPANAAFLVAGGGFERAARAPDVARIKAAPFDKAFSLRMGETAVLPDGLELSAKGHAHKRPTVGGPRKEMAEVEARTGPRAQLVVLGHVIEEGAQPRETWEKRKLGPHEIELVGMSYDADTTLRVRRWEP